VARRGEEDEWVAVLPPAYVAARNRHAAARAEAYEVTRAEAIESIAGPALRIADIDEAALAAWQLTWRGRHPSGAGGWNWPALVEQLPRRAAILPIAIWDGHDLCGLAVGHASRPRLSGCRHTVTLTHVERRPEPPEVALRGHIIGLAVWAARNYGLAVGARTLRLRSPDRHLLDYYQRHGFKIFWKGNVPVFCDREVLR
jgi:hypothetical protein